jgi:hypothetical protein
MNWGEKIVDFVLKDWKVLAAIILLILMGASGGVYTFLQPLLPQAPLNQRMSTLENTVGSFNGRIEALESQVGGFDGRIKALENTVGGYDGRIKTLENTVGSFDGRIKWLEDHFVPSGRAIIVNALYSHPYPGGTVEVQGSGFESQAVVELELELFVKGEKSLWPKSVSANERGVIVESFNIPEGTNPQYYCIRAKEGGKLVASAPLEILSSR